jgi:hypothetical protein
VDDLAMPRNVTVPLHPQLFVEQPSFNFTIIIHRRFASDKYYCTGTILCYFKHCLQHNNTQLDDKH